jgi:hypothetical protein
MKHYLFIILLLIITLVYIKNYEIESPNLKFSLHTVSEVESNFSSESLQKELENILTSDLLVENMTIKRNNDSFLELGHNFDISVSFSYPNFEYTSKDVKDNKFYMKSSNIFEPLKIDLLDLWSQKDNLPKYQKEGKWEATGGMWIESDSNISPGEFLIRQILFGKRFLKEEFGVDSKVVWLPDAFGYTYALPQIIKKSGMKYFATTKISWNEINKFPYDTFWWKGIDGTKILSHFITTPDRNNYFYTYNGMVEPFTIKGIWDNYKQKDINDELLLVFGWGDGG